MAFLAGLFARRKREPKRHQNVPEYTRTAVPDGEVVIDDPSASGKNPDSAPNFEHPLNNNNNNDDDNNNAFHSISCIFIAFPYMFLVFPCISIAFS